MSSQVVEHLTQIKFIKQHNIFLKLLYAASVFGEISRLEPMPPDSKARWRKEIDWLLSVTDHIVEFVPSQQNTNGITMEVPSSFVFCL